jgi:thymidylate kinase
MATFILISGPDGVGKSTILSLLKATCKLRGIICLSGYMRSTSLPVRLIKKILVMTGRKDLTHTPIFHRPIIDADPIIITRLINLFIVIDIIIFSFKVILYKTLMALLDKIYKKVIILFERYALDTVVDLIYMKKVYKPNKNVFLIAVNLFLRYNKDIDYIIILDANFETITKRHTIRKQDEFLDFISLQKNLLPKLASMYTDKFHYINTSNDKPMDTWLKVYNLISHCLE